MPEPDSLVTVSGKPFVLVLGMHRSGTSCLTGCLERCGLNLGSVRRTGRFNAKGYYEIQTLEHLHNQVLGLNGGSWHQPPAEIISIHLYHQQALKVIVGQLSMRRPCGVKDPRLLLLLDDWLKLIKLPYKLVGTFRHPLAVAKSLKVRNGISEAKGIDLWLHYNSRLIQRHKMTPFPLVAFDLTDIDSYCYCVAIMAFELGLLPKHSHLCHFVNKKLDHHTTKAPVPSVCQETFDYLQENSITAAQSPREQVYNWLGLMQEVIFNLNNRIDLWGK